MAIRHEAQLYAPISRFFQSQGFDVRGEVEGCDLVAVRGDETVVVELKRAFNLALVLQGIDRQRITDHVFLAVEAPRKRPHYNWREIHRLCRKLGLGLITVAFVRRKPQVAVEMEPGPYRPRKSKQRHSSLLREFNGRSADFNTGGTTGRPIVTAYREEALRVARQLRIDGPSKVGHLRESAASPKAGSILLNNFYGWFQRVAHGTYQLAADGERALEKYADVVADADGNSRSASA